MPSVLRIAGFRFFFYMQEGGEPAHIHVESGDGEAKFWLAPIALAFGRGYAEHELRRVASHHCRQFGGFLRCL